MRSILTLSAVLGVFLSVSCGGCDEVDPPPDSGPSPSADAGASDAGASDAGASDAGPSDVALVGSCRVDSDCGLGTHCDLGRCLAGCDDDDECGAGETCSDSGRCVSGASVSIVADTRGRLDMRPRVFPSLVPDDGDVTLSLLARDADVARLRVVASDGLAFDCPVAASDDGCLLEDGLANGASLAIVVRATRPAEPGEIREVRLYTPGRVHTVSVAPPPLGVEAALAANPSGVWQGHLENVEDGFLHPSESFTAAAPFQQVPLGAKIYAAGLTGSGIVVLEDMFSVLHPEGAWIGTLDLAPDADAGPNSGNTLTLPSYVRHGSLGVGAPTMLRVEATVGPLHFDAESATLYFDIEVHSRGMMNGGEGLTASYRANLRRTGPLPASDTPPTVPVAETFLVEGDSCASETCPDFSDTPLTDGQSYFGIDRCRTIDSSYQPLTCQRAGREPIPWEALAWQRDIDEEGYDFDLTEVQGAPSVWSGATPAPLEYCFVNHDDFTWLRRAGSGIFGAGHVPPLCGFFSTCNYGNPSGATRTLTEWQGYNPVHKAFADFFIAQGYSPTSSVRLSVDDGWSLPNGDDWNRADIPCELDLPATDITMTCNGTASARPFAATHIDMCDQIAAQIGCEVTDEVFGSPVNIPYNHLTGDDPTCGNVSYWSMDVPVQRVCRLKAVPDSCSQTVLCGGTAPVAPVDPLTGEYPCAGGGVVGISADVRASEAATLGQAISTDALFESCLLELDDLFESGPTGPSAEPLTTLLAPSECIQPTRFFTALGVALNTNHRLRLFDDTAVSAGWEEDVYGRSLRNERVAHRLVQRWLQIHAFLAKEASDREILGRIVREEAVPGEEVPSLDEILATSLRGWELFHHPRYALALSELSPDVLLSPDWRAELDEDVVSASHHEHGKALSVVILETLSAQLDLADQYLELAAFASNPAAIDDVKPLFTEIQTMRAWASGLMRKAEAAAVAEGGTLPWADDYETALVHFTSSHNRVVSRALNLKNGTNPLGIEDNDLPLYFFGSQQGPGERFSAVSDFLLGQVGTSDVGWATQLIDAADTSFSSARAKWLDLKNRGWQESRDSAAQADKEAEVRIGYGDAINDLCFLDAASFDVLDLASIDAATCYVNTSDPQCQVDARTFARRATAADVNVQLCITGELIDQGFLGVELGDSVLTGIAFGFAGTTSPCSSSSYDPECTTFGDAGCFTCESAAGTLTAPISPSSMRVTSDASMAAAVSTAQDKCLARYPSGRIAVPFADNLENPACLRGAMGESQLTILAAARDIEIAKAELDEFQESYDIVMKGCLALQTANANIASATRDHNDAMQGLRNGKFAADTVANVAGGVKDCANAAVSAAGALDPGSKVSAGAATAASCTAGAVETAGKIASDAFQLAMDNAQAKHEAAVAQFERTAEIAVCQSEADLQLVGNAAAMLRIQRAIDDMVLAMYALEQQKRNVDVLFAEGKVELARVAGRAVSPPTAGLWLDEDVQEFRRRIRLARRVTYLAVRAMEYEFQSSLAMRTETIEASTPNELRAVTDELRTISATGGVNGSQPSDLKVVLSLRDHLLQLAHRTSPPPGTPAMTDVERLREVLGSPRYKAYDDNGAFTGLRIPFEIAPLEVLGLGNASGIGIFAGTDCAERLWSANASVVGSANVLRGGSSFTRMDLMKRNTFYSQWCGAPQGGTEFQQASVRPSRNLFREPGFGTDLGGSLLGLSKSTDAYTRARLQPAVNVSRQEFEDDSYANGQTAELAGRGIYGNYELFIPTNMLSVLQNGLPTDGLDISELDDILIRLDYVSVSQ